MAILGRLWLFWTDYGYFGRIMAILAILSVPRRETTDVDEVSSTAQQHTPQQRAPAKRSDPATQAFLTAFKHATDTLGIEPRTSRRLPHGTRKYESPRDRGSEVNATLRFIQRF